MNEKELALSIKKRFFYHYYNFDNFCCIEEAFDNDVNISLLKQELAKFGLQINKAHDIPNLSKDILEETQDFKYLVYADNTDL